MKRILGISLVSVMMAMPMMANAAPVAGDPGATTAGAPTATSAPKYALKEAAASDGNVASAAYVKGAYNALIKGINKTQDEVTTLNSGISTYQGNINGLLNGKATQDGTVATVKHATTNETINGSSVNITGVTTSSISAKASGNVNLSVPIKNDWNSDAVATNPIQTTTTFTNLTVNGLSMSAPSANTATLTKNNIGGTVNVANYIAQAAAAAAHYSGYQTLIISPMAGSYGYITADGSDSDNADGLSNGEWKVTWNSYGTAKGTSMCSSDLDYEQGDTITGTPASIMNPDAKAGCWCKLTGFTDNNNTTYNDTSLWVFYDTNSSASNCASLCANDCGYDVRLGLSAMRSGLFGSVQ